jgi:tetratricopeptide (TPR) repeat protein
MSSLKNIKSLMNWILAGSLIGLTVAIMRWLFDWDSTVANYVLFGSAGSILAAMLIMQFFHYQKIRTMLKNYMSLLESWDMEQYILKVTESIEKTHPKHYKDIHRINLATGYSYLGQFEKAIQQLKIVYESSKNSTKTAIFCLINIAYYYIQMGEYVKAEKLMLSFASDPKNLEKDPQINFLYHINLAYIYLRKKDAKQLKDYLDKAQLIQRSFGSGDIEMLKLNIEASLFRKEHQETKQWIYEFKLLDLPPYERQWVSDLEIKVFGGKTSEINREE